MPSPSAEGADHPTVRIHYTRPPDRVQIFVQELVHDTAEVKVTFARDVPLAGPLVVQGRTILEPGSDAVWFTFPDAWHDIGRFHLRDGTFTGVYANVLTPCAIGPGHEWRTTDLCLDLWIPAAAWRPGEAVTPALLDEDELAEAARKGWIDDETAARARAEATRLLEEAASGRWPPRIVAEWTRERMFEVG